MTLGGEIRDDLNRLPFVESDMGKKILNCKHCDNCKPMKPEYQKYNFLEDDSVAFCVKRECCVHLDDVCAMLAIDICEYCDVPTYSRQVETYWSWLVKYMTAK